MPEGEFISPEDFHKRAPTGPVPWEAHGDRKKQLQDPGKTEKLGSRNEKLGILVSGGAGRISMAAFGGSRISNFQLRIPHSRKRERYDQHGTKREGSGGGAGHGRLSGGSGGRDAAPGGGATSPPHLPWRLPRRCGSRPGTSPRRCWTTWTWRGATLPPRRSRDRAF